MNKQISTQVTSVVSDAKTVYKNLIRLIEALSLLSVAVFSVYSVYHTKNSEVAKDSITVAGAIIGVRGGYEFLRHLANKV